EPAEFLRRAGRASASGRRFRGALQAADKRGVLRRCHSLLDGHLRRPLRSPPPTRLWSPSAAALHRVFTIPAYTQVAVCGQDTFTLVRCRQERESTRRAELR